MELQTITNAVNLVWQIATPTSSTKPCIATGPMKAPFEPGPIAQPFPRAQPEEMGMPSGVLEDYYRALNDDRALDMHSVTVIKDGSVVAEASFGAYDRSVWHISYSECKSVVGLAIGMLVDEGRLDIDDKVIKLLPERLPPIALITMKDLTVRHLLTMTSGASFNEAGSVTEEDWARCYLESTVQFEHGSRFNYNSMNTYILSAIICRITGGSLTEYLRPRLWEPLGITRVFWEKCPKGVEKGGWGLYMRQEDFAKIGQLVLNGGVWNGERLISKGWLDEATSPQSFPPESLGDYDYGYQIWCGRGRHSFLFSGMFGQNVLGFFDTGVLLVTNAGNDELFQSSSFFTHTHKYLGRDFGQPLPEDAAACRSLREYLEGLAWRGKPAAPAGLCGELDGRTYRVTSKNALSIGLLPVMVQAVQNIYTRGILGLSFTWRDGRLTLAVRELDAVYELPVGFDAPEYAQLDFHGERHRVAITGRAAKNEDDLDVLIIRVSFLETASSRLIRIYFEPDKRSFTARWHESPGAPFLEQSVESVLGDLKLHQVIAGLLDKYGIDLASYKIRSTFTPEITAEEQTDD